MRCPTNRPRMTGGKKLIVLFSTAILLVCLISAFQDAIAGEPPKIFSNKLEGNDLFFDVLTDGPPNFVIEKWKSEDQGETWQLMGMTTRLTPIIEHSTKIRGYRAKHDFKALTEGVYYFKCKPVSLKVKGNMPPEKGEQPDFILVIDVSPPNLLFDPPKAGSYLVVGQPVPIKWFVKDKHMKQDGITIELSKDGGLSWEVIASKVQNNGLYLWTPKESDVNAQGQLRITAMDLAGNGAARTMDGTFVLSRSKIYPHKYYRRPNSGWKINNPINFSIEGHKTNSNWQFDVIALYSRVAGEKNWGITPELIIPTNPQKEKSFYVTAPRLDLKVPNEGTYEYFAKCTTREQAGIIPDGSERPSFVVVVDHTAPTIAITRPLSGSTIEGYTCIIEWAAKDALSGFNSQSIIVEASENGIKWIPVLGPHPNTGSYTWVMPPSDKDREYWIKILATDQAGNTAATMLKNPVRFTAQKKAIVKWMGDKKRINALNIDIPINVTKTVKSNIKRIELYYRICAKSWGERTVEPWERYGIVPGNSKRIFFKAPVEGLYDFYFRPVSGAEKSLPAPDANTNPTRRILLARAKPHLQIIFPMKDRGNRDFYIAGDKTITIRYVAAGAFLKPNSVTLEYFDENGKANKIAEGIPNSGEYTWTPPARNIPQSRLQLRVVDLVNSGVQITQTQSERFDIDNEIPAIEPGDFKVIEEKTKEANPAAVKQESADFLNTLMVARRLLDTERKYRAAIDAFLKADTLLSGNQPDYKKYKHSIYYCVGISYMLLGENLSSPKDLTSAMDYFKLALDMKKGDIYTRWGIARVYYSLGQYKEAIPFLKEVYLGRDRYTQTSGIMLARSYWHLKNYEETKKYWQLVLEDKKSNLSPAEFEEAEARLKECEKLIKNPGKDAPKKRQSMRKKKTNKRQ